MTKKRGLIFMERILDNEIIIDLMEKIEYPSRQFISKTLTQKFEATFIGSPLEVDKGRKKLKEDIDKTYFDERNKCTEQYNDYITMIQENLCDEYKISKEQCEFIWNGIDSHNDIREILGEFDKDIEHINEYNAIK